MSDIKWLEPNREVGKHVPEGADVRIRSNTAPSGKKITCITFYNFSDKKVIKKNDRIMVGINDVAIYLKEPEGLQKGRKIVRKTPNDAGTINIWNLDFRDIFKDIDGLQGYFKLQYSVSKDAWFIAESGRIDK